MLEGSIPQPEDHQSEMRDSARTPEASYFVTDSFGSESELCGNFEVYTLWGIMREIRQELRSTPVIFSVFVILHQASTPIYKLPSVSNHVTTSANMDVSHLLPSFRQGALITAVGLLLYTLTRITHNVFFHPLSRFPGPRGAACTKWWLAYMEYGRGVSLSTLRVELHQKYGTFPWRSF